MAYFNLDTIPSLKDQDALNRWYRLSFALTVVVISALALGHLCLINKAQKFKPLLLKNEELKAHIQELQESYQKEQVAYRRLAEMSPSDRNSSDTLGNYLMELANLIPDNVRLSVMTFEAQRRLLLSGTARNLEDLTLFFKRLKYESCFKRHVITEIKQQKEGSGYFNFSVTLEYI